MRIEERIDVPVSAAAAWDFMWQTKRLAACLPGCVGVEEVEPQKRYTAQFEDAVGPYKVRFDMTVTVVEAVAGKLLRLRVVGEDKRIGASQTADLTVTLEPQGDARTALAVVAEVQILGKIATLGQFVIKRKVKQVVSEFAKNVDRELRGAAPTESTHGQ